MRKDRIWQYGANAIPCIVYWGIFGLAILSIAILGLCLYVINWFIIVCVVLAIIAEIALTYSMLKRTKAVIYNDTTIEVRNLFGILVKKEDIDNLRDIRKLHLCEGREWSGEFYCLAFSDVIIHKKRRQEVDKMPHIIIIRDTQKSYDFLREYLPEKWLPYLDQPVEK